MRNLKIGTLADRTGTQVATIRYYEQIGLLPPAEREPSGQRIYGAMDVERLTFIRRCRDFGFSIDQTRVFSGLMRDPSSSCMDARDLAAQHLADVRGKLQELKALERSLASFVHCCDTSCAGGPGPDCIILGDQAKATPKARHA